MTVDLPPSDRPVPVDCLVADLDPRDNSPRDVVVSTSIPGLAIIDIYTSSGEKKPRIELALPSMPDTPPFSLFGLSAGDLDGNGDLELVLVTGTLEGDGYFSVDAMHHDGTRVAGNWPIPPQQELVLRPPLVADVDEDGRSEVLAASANFLGDRRSHAFLWNGRGEEMTDWGWPKAFDAAFNFDPVFSSPGLSAGDLDGDGDLEVIVAARRVIAGPPYNWSTAYAWHHDARGLQNEGLYAGFPADLFGRSDMRAIFVGTPVIAGIVHQDGEPQILQAALVERLDDPAHPLDQTIFLIGGDGGRWRLWDVLIVKGRVQDKLAEGASDLTVADVVGDARPEIFQAVGNQLFGLTFNAGHWGFEWLPGAWPVTLSGQRARGPVIADVNGDAQPDVLVLTSGDEFSSELGAPPPVFLPELHAFRADGTRAIVPWDPFTPVLQGNLAQSPSRLSVADVDNDGDTETVFSFPFRTDAELKRLQLQTVVMDTSGRYETSAWPMPQHDPGRTGWYRPEDEPPVHFLRGDTDRSGGLNLTDAIHLLNGLFRSGPPPTCPDAADANDDGTLDISDAVRLLGHLFLGAGPLPAPFPDAGPDPTPDDPLGCNR